MTNDLLQKLAGGDRRSIGRANEVVADVLKNLSRFEEVMAGLLEGEDLRVRLRAADAIEKITARHPEYLGPFTRRLIALAARAAAPEIRWHLAQMLPRLELSRDNRRRVVKTLLAYLKDESRIVRTFAMQALADLAEGDRRLRPYAEKLIKRLTTTGSPAMQSRGRKLLERLA